MMPHAASYHSHSKHPALQPKLTANLVGGSESQPTRRVRVTESESGLASWPAGLVGAAADTKAATGVSGGVSSLTRSVKVAGGRCITHESLFQCKFKTQSVVKGQQSRSD
jgi:hypothetical protein